MGNVTIPEITYSALGDLLSIWAGISEGSAQIVTMKPNCSSFYSGEGRKCVGVYWYDAGRILLPMLERDDTSELLKYPELIVDYCRETDVLVFGNRGATVRSEEIAAGIIAHIDSAGLVNRFTLKNASATLLPRFRRPIDKDDVTRAGTGADGLAESPAR